MKLIPLFKGENNQFKDKRTESGIFALVDDEDYDFLMQWKWMIEYGRKRYAKRSGRLNGKQTTIRMHRVIMKTTNNLICDHIDHNGLNNQKSNLRNCTNTENIRNRKPRIFGTSKYNGVYWNKKTSKWVARIMVNRKGMHIGSFDSEIEAAVAYNLAAIKYFGEFASLNTIKND